MRGKIVFYLYINISVLFLFYLMTINLRKKEWMQGPTLWDLGVVQKGVQLEDMIRHQLSCEIFNQLKLNSRTIDMDTTSKRWPGGASFNTLMLFIAPCTYRNPFKCLKMEEFSWKSSNLPQSIHFPNIPDQS